MLDFDIIHHWSEVAVKRSKARLAHLEERWSHQRLSQTQSIAVARRLVADYVRPHFKQLSVAALAMMVSAAATAGLAMLFEPLFNWIFVSRESWVLIATASGFVGVAKIGRAHV